MATINKWYLKRKGTPPGTLLEKKPTKKRQIYSSAFVYNKDGFKELEAVEPDELIPTPKESILWYNLEGELGSKILEKVGAEYKLHPLVLEDIQNTVQRPKMVDYDDHIYFTIKMLSWNNRQNRIDHEQISLVLIKNAVLSIQQAPGDVFDPVRQRIRDNKGRVRTEKSDYLAFSLLDCVVDEYFYIIEKLHDKYEELEEEVLFSKDFDALSSIHEFRKQISTVRRAVWPLRDILKQIEKDTFDLISEETESYFRNLYDNVLQVMDNVDMLRDMFSGLVDYHEAKTANSMNSVMKILTVITSIFIPLSFVTGIFGMNFFNMPILHTHLGYYLVLGVMGFLGLGMAGLFKWKKWI